ncbi:IS110 family transposase [Acinetobacter sp. WCHAc010034]|uniref:IS110 family transposase n=1 Tax=Acinetobacter sp. WCHAc010034 TaxID=1879049 RepID=UPI000E658AF0|nr:IS110 family transposase [Acinetobacter sp. WCHAc010034]AYA04381.1 IS110 family transposase [Acinetobacter sp. WCHAc010034]
MFYLGIDVAKAKIDCCLILEDSAGKKKTKTFPNTPKGFEQLQAWLNHHAAGPAQAIALMEATSVYHERLARHLFDAGFQVCVANPARARYFAQSMSRLNKTDKADSEVLARFAMTADLHFWQPLPGHIQLLNALLDRRAVLGEDLQREENRLEKAESTFTIEPVLQSIHKNIKQLSRHIQDLDRQIDDHIDQHPDLKNDKALLSSIPAIADRTSLLMLSFLRSHAFERASQAAAFAGLVPIQRQSGSSIHGRSRLSKAGPSKIRAGLYMAAIVATRHNPHIKGMNDRLLANGKTKMMAVGAAMRKLIHLCYGVLKHQRPYQENYCANSQ